MATTTPTHCLNCNHSLVSHFHTSDWGKVGACQKTRAEGSWRCTCPMFEPDRRSGKIITLTVEPDTESLKRALEEMSRQFDEWVEEKTAQDKRFEKFWEEVEKEHEEQRVEKSTRHPWPPPPRPVCGKCEHPYTAHLRAWPDDTYEEKDCHMPVGEVGAARECLCVKYQPKKIGVKYQPKKIEFQVKRQGF